MIRPRAAARPRWLSHDVIRSCDRRVILIWVSHLGADPCSQSSVAFKDPKMLLITTLLHVAKSYPG